MNDSTDRLTTALSRSYRLERELGQGGMATVLRMNSLLGSAWLRHATMSASRMSRGDALPSRGVQPREQPRS